MTPIRRMETSRSIFLAAMALSLAAAIACGGAGSQPQAPAGNDSAAAGGAAHPSILDDVHPNTTGGSAAMPGNAAGATPPQIMPPPAGAGVGASAITWTVPTGWTEEPPSSPMRRAQYHIPGGSGAESDGECMR